MPTYSLAELAKLADVTPRTVRFYIAQGLLPQPDLQGPNTRYTDEHLARLRAIKRLQAAHLPLAEIREQLRAVPEERMAALAAFGRLTPSAAGSAADYIRDVLETPGTMYRMAMSAPAPPVGQATTQPEPATRSQWDRISLDPDIELHVRRPLTKQNNKRVERLIAIARELFEED